MVPEPKTRCGGKSGVLQRGVGEHVDGIGGDENDAVGIVASDFGDDFSEDRGVTLHEVKTGLAGLLCGACGDDGDGGASAIRIVSSPNVRGVGERDGMTQVHGFAFGLGAIYVDKNDFSGEATEHERVCKSGAHIAKSDDSNTSCAVGTVHLDSPQLKSIVTRMAEKTRTHSDYTEVGLRISQSATCQRFLLFCIR